MSEMTDIIEKELWATIVWKVMSTTNTESQEGKARLNNVKKKLEKECKQYIALSLGEMLKQPTTGIYRGSSEELLEEIVSKAKKVDEEFRSNESTNNDMKKIEVVSATQEEVEKSNLELNNPDVFKCEKCGEITDHSRIKEEGIGWLWQCKACGHKTTRGQAIFMTKTEGGYIMMGTIVAEVISPTDPESEEGMARVDNIRIQLSKEWVECEQLAAAYKLLPQKYGETFAKLLGELVKKAKNIDNRFQSGEIIASSEHNNAQKSKGKSCYIATACYGSYTHPDVQTFRTFRDNVLINSIIGRLFVSFYYTVSPPLARQIGNMGWLATGIRKFFLQPIASRLRKKYK